MSLFILVWLVVETGKFGEFQHPSDKGMAIFTRHTNFSKQFPGALRIFGFAFGQLRHVDYAGQGIVQLVRYLTDHQTHGGEFLYLDNLFDTRY